MKARGSCKAKDLNREITLSWYYGQKWILDTTDHELICLN